MNEKTDQLMDRWIMTFLEPPPFADPDLMAQLLAEHDAKTDHGVQGCGPGAEG